MCGVRVCSVCVCVHGGGKGVGGRAGRLRAVARTWGAVDVSWLSAMTAWHRRLERG